MKQLRINIDDFFKDLSFIEETHKYFVKGEPLKKSVSGLIHKYEFPTDWDKVLKQAAEKRGVTPEVEKARWKKEEDFGCALGTETHLFAEVYAVDRTLKPKTGHQRAVVNFWNDLPDFIVPLFLELKMYHKEIMFAGTADLIFYNTKTKQITIGDYKTNKDLFKNFKRQRMQGPFGHLIDCPFNHYQLQLSYYQILLEQYLQDTDVKVVGRKLIYLKDSGDYEIYELDDYTEVLREELKLYGI